MRTEDFNYHLPGHLIALEPTEPRDACRLLVLSRGDGKCRHLHFRDLATLLRPGDRLVFNDTRVLPARVFTRKATGGRVEVFFLEKAEGGAWKALVNPARRAPPGTVLEVEECRALRLRVADVMPDGTRMIRADAVPADATIESIMERHGHIPLPRYIRRGDGPSDRRAYQTIYAKTPGAVAAPTAGLHFTGSLMERLRLLKVDFSYITLHVGVGTFRPVKVDNPADHRMHEERFIISPEAAGQIERTREQGGRIIAVGTTVVRVLEHCFAAAGRLFPHEGATRIMIMPPYRFGMVDALVTNFHLPKSTLLMLVSAFAGRECVLNAYGEAIAAHYRFYSYGDAMFIC